MESVQAPAAVEATNILPGGGLEDAHPAARATGRSEEGARAGGRRGYPTDGGEQRTGIAPNELTSVEDRDPFVGTPWHKHVPARVERA